jgi:uncharacterized membrane protein
MEELLRDLALWVARGVETIAALVIAFGALEAAFRIFTFWSSNEPRSERDRVIFRRFARWLVLALEFTLAADIVRTAVSPTWDDIGQLAAIAAIRTALNYFLERDLERAAPEKSAKAESAAPQIRPRSETA